MLASWHKLEGIPTLPMEAIGWHEKWNMECWQTNTLGELFHDHVLIDFGEDQVRISSRDSATYYITRFCLAGNQIKR